jgi:hypothetical protein
MSLSGQKSMFREIMYANITDDMKYRYTLTRAWKKDQDKRWVNFIMLNPSTADEVNDDATIRRCLGYADSWGYNGILVTNLFAWRATDPRWIKCVDNPVGSENDAYLVRCADICSRTVCAWGNNGNYQNRDQEVIKLLKNHVSLFCLGLTRSGQPKHPLRLSGSLKPQLWIIGELK